MQTQFYLMHLDQIGHLLSLNKFLSSQGFKGQEGVKKAKQIAELLNAGSLPVDLKEIYSNSE
jgi:preprotein translocase subunit SecD